ncbi:IS110 family RNA-guided transposase [Limnochorda pilosa]|uniref:Transposase n=1 Tax=Limnochorda pilosa TaxID=1555112 RepID=A0A0K2SI74_LIMPI|nr:IS110 family transposase [Limnochorda pilosa]BAS26785.1 transposase [Limnochorda pilosa]
MKTDEKITLVRSNTLIVAVEVVKKTHYARVIDQVGRTVEEPFEFHNGDEGFRRLERRLLRRQAEIGAERVIIGMEPTGHYWKPLAYWLVGRGYTVVLVNPIITKRPKEDRDNSPSKTDPKDTGVIADLVLQGKFLEVLLPKGVYANLRQLNVARRELKAKLSSGKNRLHAILDEFFPEFTDVFKDPLGMGALWVLEHCPFPDDVLPFPFEELIGGRRQASRNRVGRARAEKLFETAWESVGVQEGLEGARVRLRSTLVELRVYKEQLVEVEAAMKRQLEATGVAEYLLSIPGIGMVLAAGFLAETGDLSAYRNWRQLRNLAGLNVKQNSSGKHKGKTTITKRGRPGLREVLYQAAIGVAQHSPELRELYHYWLSRPQNPLKPKAALVALGLKALRIMSTLATRKEYYGPAKVLGEVRKTQLRAA